MKHANGGGETQNHTPSSERTKERTREESLQLVVLRGDRIKHFMNMKRRLFDRCLRWFETPPFTVLLPPKLLKELQVWHLILCSLFSHTCFLLLLFHAPWPLKGGGGGRRRARRLFIVKATDTETRGHAVKAQRADVTRRGRRKKDIGNEKRLKGPKWNVKEAKDGRRGDEGR